MRPWADACLAEGMGHGHTRLSARRLWLCRWLGLLQRQPWGWRQSIGVPFGAAQYLEQCSADGPERLGPVRLHGELGPLQVCIRIGGCVQREPQGDLGTPGHLGDHAAAPPASHALGRNVKRRVAEQEAEQCGAGLARSENPQPKLRQKRRPPRGKPGPGGLALLHDPIETGLSCQAACRYNSRLRLGGAQQMQRVQRMVPNRNTRRRRVPRRLLVSRRRWLAGGAGLAACAQVGSREDGQHEQRCRAGRLFELQGQLQLPRAGSRQSSHRRAVRRRAESGSVLRRQPLLLHQKRHDAPAVADGGRPVVAQGEHCA
eukprot:scaffold6123_cov113-Isochrysis_galbana.AAC.6